MTEPLAVWVRESHDHSFNGDHASRPWHFHVYEDCRPEEENVPCPGCGAGSGEPCRGEDGNPKYAHAMARDFWHMIEVVPSCCMARSRVCWDALNPFYPDGGVRLGGPVSVERTDAWLSLMSRPENGPGTARGICAQNPLPDGVDPTDPRVAEFRRSRMDKRCCPGSFLPIETGTTCTHCGQEEMGEEWVPGEPGYFLARHHWPKINERTDACIWTIPEGATK